MVRATDDATETEGQRFLVGFAVHERMLRLESDH